MSFLELPEIFKIWKREQETAFFDCSAQVAVSENDPSTTTLLYLTTLILS